MKKQNSFFSAKNISYLAVLTALVIVLQAFVGAINIGVVQLNFSLIPIVLGAIFLGIGGGAFLGFVCGIVVFVQVTMGLNPFYSIIWAHAPVVTFFTCTVKTTVAGLVAGLLYRIFSKKNHTVGVFVAAGIVPVFNTALFILGCLCMTDAIQIFQGTTPNSGMNVFVFILIGIVTFNFFIEFALNLLLSPALCRVESIVNHRIKQKQQTKQTATELSEKEGNEQ